MALPAAGFSTCFSPTVTHTHAQRHSHSQVWAPAGGRGVPARHKQTHGHTATPSQPCCPSYPGPPASLGYYPLAAGCAPLSRAAGVSPPLRPPSSTQPLAMMRVGAAARAAHVRHGGMAQRWRRPALRKCPRRACCRASPGGVGAGVCSLLCALLCYTLALCVVRCCASVLCKNSRGRDVVVRELHSLGMGRARWI